MEYARFGPEEWHQKSANAISAICRRSFQRWSGEREEHQGINMAIQWPPKNGSFRSHQIDKSHDQNFDSIVVDSLSLRAFNLSYQPPSPNYIFLISLIICQRCFFQAKEYLYFSEQNVENIFDFAWNIYFLWIVKVEKNSNKCIVGLCCRSWLRSALFFPFVCMILVIACKDKEKKSHPPRARHKFAVFVKKSHKCSESTQRLRALL